jgi:hypothetical protein
VPPEKPSFSASKHRVRPSFLALGFALEEQAARNSLLHFALFLIWKQTISNFLHIQASG